MSINEINSEELRAYIKSHNEKEFLLVDVRQPEEYREGHIPGARLLPLPELVKRMETLPRDQELIFYCRSGSRSMAASTMVEEEFGERETFYNLKGGLLSWDGAVAENPPQVRIFEKNLSTADMYVTAMDLEKGAMNFYTTVDMRYGGEDWSDVFGRLAEAEISHALAVYRLWRKEKPDAEEFDKVFAGLPGNVLEGGMTLAEALDRASSPGGSTCLRLMELALAMEYSAFDLYRTMADKAESPKIRETFIRIAQAEKSHMGILIDALGSCPA